MTDRVRVAVDGHVAIVTLDRPEKHNAVDLPMFAALADAGRRLAADSAVRAVVLEGAGPSFCAGVDTGIFQQGENAISPTTMAPGESTPANFFQSAAYVWRELPVPVICAMHGTVFGAGLQIALGADLRFASADCRVSVMEIAWGIIPDMAISTTMPRLLAADRAKELAWTGRVLSGAEAFELGLVTALHQQPATAARETAQAIAAQSPDAVRAIKVLFDETPQMTPAEALQLEATLQLSLLGSGNQLEAVRARLEKRLPQFKNPPA